MFARPLYVWLHDYVQAWLPIISERQKTFAFDNNNRQLSDQNTQDLTQAEGTADNIQEPTEATTTQHILRLSR